MRKTPIVFGVLLLGVTGTVPSYAELSTQEQVAEIQQAWREACTQPASQSVIDWERAQAVYQRDRDYASLATQPAVPEAKAKQALIEARFHIALAALSEVYEKHADKARAELHAAIGFLKRAQSAASTDLASRLKSQSDGLDALAANLGQRGECQIRAEKPRFEKANQALHQLILGYPTALD